MNKTKYIKTDDNQIILFSEYYVHNQFKKFNPVSAGFVYFDYDNVNNIVDCHCYGESISLGLKSDQETDSNLVKKQILGYNIFNIF
ncbi:MAG: hypothetical protein WC554_09725 [Clostridia bacterium]